LPTPTADEIDFYKMLGISYEASQADIKRAYRQAMKRSHPDKVAPERRPEAEAQARILNDAYRTLSNPAAKQKYDNLLKAEKLQDQIMSRYSGGLGAPGADQDIYARIKEAQRLKRTKQQRESDRQATSSLLLIFVGFALIILLVLIVGSIAGSLVHRLS
jgi:DnaJ-class molecular chaperone